jgi:ArsR family transcriptional regulator
MRIGVKERFRSLARLLKAPSHPSRLIIADELSRRARCVCELRELIGAGMSTVSKHLSGLRGAGLVEDERRGVRVYYSPRAECMGDFFDCLAAVMQPSAGEGLEVGGIRR